MSETRMARTAIAGIRSVCRYARPASAVRWLTSFAAHLPECKSTRSLVPADRIWARTGARFQLPGGAAISLPGAYTAGAREMYCRNVYLRVGLVMPRTGWVLDLGASRGLFSVWAALAGAQVVAVEAQQGFGPEIRRLAAYNGIGDRVHVEIALAGGIVTAGATAGVVADDQRWATTSHGAARRPTGVSVPQLMSAYQIGRVGLLKVDIEGGEFAVFGNDEDLRWLDRVDLVVIEVHPGFGDAAALVGRLRQHGFAVDLRDNAGTGSLPPLADLTRSAVDGHEHLVHEVSDAPVSRPCARRDRAGRDPVPGGIEDLCTVDEDAKASPPSCKGTCVTRNFLSCTSQGSASPDGMARLRFCFHQACCDMSVASLGRRFVAARGRSHE
jgi:FkbM family methyltransferase